MTQRTFFGKEVDRLASEMDFIRLKMSVNIPYFTRWPLVAEQSFNRYTMEYYLMAAKLKKELAKKPVKQAEFSWKGFINVNLNADQKEAYKAWDVQDDDVWDGLSQYIAAGYKVSLSFNKQNDKFNCTGTGQPESGVNSGYAVSAFANTPYEAARVWLFKVATILPDDWTQHQVGDADDIG